MSEDTEPEGRAAGGCMLLVAGLGTGAAVFAYSRDAFVILVWIIGSLSIWWAARKPVLHTPDPAPPPLPERGSEKEPQVTMLRDQEHPNRWIVTRPSPWLTEEIDNSRDADDDA